MKAKHIFKQRLLLLALSISSTVSFTLSGCSDMLDSDSGRFVLEEDNQLNTVNDSLYSAIGILSQLQPVADQLLLFGELRGDLMVTSENASAEMKEIEAFNISKENSLAATRQYYNIINNCNYAIAKLDTGIILHQEKVLLPEFAAIKAIRAWIYFQMGLVYGEAKYITQPILTLEDSEKEYPILSLDNLIETLITDLKPYTDVRMLDYGSLDGKNTRNSFFPIPMLLGDFYLYQNDYENAAQMYYRLIRNEEYTISDDYANYYSNNIREDIIAGNQTAYGREIITQIAFNSSLKALHSQMAKWTYSDEPWLLPASQFVKTLETRTHFYSEPNGSAISRYFDGDLRGYGKMLAGKALCNAFGPIQTDIMNQQTLITKYYNNLSGSESDEMQSRRLLTVPVYRHPHLYLRFAEALNRLGKPTIAFAILKYGLNQLTLSSDEKINPEEYSGESYLDFNSGQFAYNIGTAQRGIGFGVKFDTRQYIIPESETLQDSILAVEEIILEELSAETAFEGNRFLDLLLLSRHRDNHPEFMADKVSAKYENKEQMKQHLSDMKNWFVR